MSYRIRINPGQTDEIEIRPDRLVSIGFNKTHTALSDFQGLIPQDTTLSEEVFSEIYLERDPDGDNELLFRGELLSTESDFDGATTNISGKGVGYRLTNKETSVTYQNRLAHNAIEDFWNNQTVFTPTVTAPSATASTTNQQAQQANTTAEFADIVSIADDVPLEVRNGNIELLETSFTQEGESWSSSTFGAFESNANYSDGNAAIMGTNNPQAYEYNFTIDHTIPREDFELAIRWDSTNTNSGTPPKTNWLLDNEFIGDYSPVGTSISWQPAIIENTANGTAPSNDLEPGQHTIRFELESLGDESFYLDVLQPYDTGDRFGGFSYTYDNDNGGSSGYLDGPELYPDSVTKSLNAVPASWNINSGTLSTTWNDTTNSQKIQLRLGDQTWFPNDGTENNTTSVTTSFGTEVGSAIQGRATWSRYPVNTNPQNATPRFGYNGQHLQSWEITFDGDNVPVISSQTFEGSLFQIAQDLHNFARMRFTFGHERNSLPVESFRAGEVTESLPNDLVITNKTQRTDASNAANHITIRGQTVDGTRLSHTVSDSTSISTFGQQHFDQIDPNLKTEEAVQIAARQTLQEKLKEFDQKGDIQIAPTDIQPGPSYPNQFNNDPANLPLEETQFSVDAGSISGTLVFDFRVPALQFAEDFGSIRRDSRNTRLGF